MKDSQNTFSQDLEFGHEGEEVVLDYIRTKYECAVRIPKKFSDYDIWIPEISKSVDVKYDVRSNDTGNFFIELYMSGKPSGLLSSKADWWVFYDGHRFYWIELEKLKQLIILSSSNWIEVQPKGDKEPKKAFIMKKSLMSHYSFKNFF